MKHLRIKILVLLIIAAYISNAQNLKEFYISYMVESGCSDDLPIQLDIYVDSVQRVCGLVLESGVKVFTVSKKGESENISIYIENSGLRAKVLDVNEWNAFKISNLDIQYLEADSSLLGLPTSKMDIQIFSMKFFTIDYIRNIKIDNSLFLPTYQSIDVLPLHIEVFDGKKCNKYTATRIEFSPSLPDTKKFMGYREMLLEDIFKVTGIIEDWFELFEIFSPVIYESKS